jgi:hypothetical protein
MFGENEMGKIKFGRALCLSILGVLSMMALFAVSAQATNLFLLEKAAAAAGSTFTGKQIGVGTLLVPTGTNLDINCAKGEVEAGSSLLSDTVALAKVLYKECTALSHTTKEELKGCTVPDILAIAKALPKSGADTFVLFEADGTLFKEKEVFTTITLSGELCALKGVYPVTGTVVALVDNNEKIEPELLFSETITKAYIAEKDELKFGVNAAFIDGTVKVSYTGTDAGKLFGIC